MSDETAPRRFSLKRNTIPIVVEMDGQERNLNLVELSGSERDVWLNDMAARKMVGANGQGQVPKNFTGLHSFLIHLSLEYADGEKAGHKVDQGKIQSWPSRVQNDLHRMALKLSGLTPEAGEEVKNDLLVND